MFLQEGGNWVGKRDFEKSSCLKACKQKMLRVGGVCVCINRALTEMAPVDGCVCAYVASAY